MTDKEIEDLIAHGETFAKSHETFAKILLLSFDVMFIDVFEKISSLFSSKSE